MTSTEFREKFKLPFASFSNPTDWQDGVGFSVIEEGENGFASIYKIGFYVRDSGVNPVKDIWVSVSYGKKTDGGISLGTTEGNLKTPIDLDFHKEFSYNTETDKFYFESKEIDPKDILLKIQKVHKLPTLIVKGLLLRLRLSLWRKIIPGGIKSADNILVRILWLISGERVKNDIMGRRLFEKSDEKIKMIEFADSKTLNFFGYQAKRWSVVFYCASHLIGYYAILKFGVPHYFFSEVFKNNFLSLCYVVVTFAIIEHSVPQFLKFIIKFTPVLYGNVLFKRLSVKAD